jgi:hypothetical protein
MTTAAAEHTGRAAQLAQYTTLADNEREVFE